MIVEVVSGLSSRSRFKIFLRMVAFDDAISSRLYTWMGCWNWRGHGGEWLKWVSTRHGGNSRSTSLLAARLGRS